MKVIKYNLFITLFLFICIHVCAQVEQNPLYLKNYAPSPEAYSMMQYEDCLLYTSITGLVLIALLLVGFSFFSRPSEEQLAAQKRYYDSIAVVQKQEEALKAKTAAALANEKEETTSVDSTSLFFDAMEGKESFTTIQNNLVEITFVNKGGRVYSAMLKDYNGQDGKPIVLFNGSDAEMNFNFYNKKETVQTRDYYFEVVNKTDSSITTVSYTHLG